MPTRWETYPIKLEGGLTTNLGRIEQGIQAPGSATILQNFEADVQGGYTRVLGYTKFSTTAIPLTGVPRGIFQLTNQSVVVERGGRYFQSSGTSWVEKLVLPNPNILKVRTAEYTFTAATATVVVDGVNPPAYYNHTTDSMSYGVGFPAEVVGANRVAVFKSHIFFAKDQLLSFTSPFLPQDFNPANGAGVVNVGDEITGIVPFRDQLIVFCLNKIFRLSGNTSLDFVLSPITANTGCLCGDTIQEVGGDIMYLGPDGIRYLSASERDNDFGLTRASEKIQKRVLSAINNNCFYASVTLSNKNQYRLFYYLSDVDAPNSKGFVGTKFSNQTADDIAWAELKGFKVYAISKMQQRDNESVLFVGPSGFVYRLESGNSLDGEDIEAIFETPYMPITDPKVRKTIYKHTLYAKPQGNLNLRGLLKFDYTKTPNVSETFTIAGEGGNPIYGEINTVYGTAVYGSASDEQYYNNVVGSGFVVAIRYSDRSQSPPFNLNFVVLEYRMNERR